MRQRLAPKKVQKIARQTGLPVLAAVVRGGTDHRIDLFLPGGKIAHWYKDGSLAYSAIGWRIDKSLQEIGDE